MSEQYSAEGQVQSSADQECRTTHQVLFTGDAHTFFGIWIVNLMLSAVTLGIYSAWAKVRTKRYFAQNTLIDDRRFDYHATGKQIFIGRIIVVGAYVLFQVTAMRTPILSAIIAVMLFFLTPLLINRSLAFNARMTSFSGLRFGFKGAYWRAFLVYILYPILAVFTLYLAFPFVARAQHRYYAAHHRFGATGFQFESTIGPFYKAFLMAFLFGALVCVAVILSFLGPLLLTGEALSAGSLWLQFIPLSLIIVAILPAGFIYKAYIRQAAYAGTTLDGIHRFASTVRPLALLWIAVSNAVVTVLSFGLMLPWARVRMARFLADHTFVEVQGSIDEFIGGEQEKVGALGDAFTDFEGIDVDFAI